MAEEVMPTQQGNTAAAGDGKPAGQPPAKGGETPPAGGAGAPPAAKPGEAVPPKTGDGADYAPFKAPDGMGLEPATLGEFQAVAKGMGLSQEQAQSLVDLGVKLVQRNSESADTGIKDMRTEWESQVKSDKEIGGDRLAPNLEMAKQAMRQFGTPELVEFFDQTGLGNHPALVRFMVKVGKAVGEDRTVDGAATSGAAGKSAAEVFYPGM
jgi:hypothetical protein